jgi:hypothetical protein
MTMAKRTTHTSDFLKKALASLALLLLSYPSLKTAIGGHTTVENSMRAGTLVMHPWQQWGIVIVLWCAAASMWLPGKRKDNDA